MSNISKITEDEKMAAIGKIVNFLCNNVYASDIEEINETFIHCKIPKQRRSYYSNKDLLKLIKYAYENGNFISVIEAMIRDSKDNTTKEDIYKLNNSFSVLGYKLIIYSDKEITLKLDKDNISSINYFDILNIHPKIREVSEKLFEDRHYSQAILETFKEVINMVKDKANRPLDEKGKELDGKKLIMEVFNISSPLIKINDLKTQSNIDEQEGFKFIFAGAAEGIRNPNAHEIIDQKDPIRTIWYISLASLLATIVDEAKKN